MSSEYTISVPEAARRMHLSKTTMYTLVRRKDFPAFNVGNRLLVSVAGLEKWVENQIEKNQN